MMTGYTILIGHTLLIYAVLKQMAQIGRLFISGNMIVYLRMDKISTLQTSAKIFI